MTTTTTIRTGAASVGFHGNAVVAVVKRGEEEGETPKLLLLLLPEELTTSCLRP